jgi:AraC-like DNA-binding protein
MRLGGLPASVRHPISGDLPLWPPILATRGAGASSSLHAHHALHLVVCVEGTLRVRRSPRARWAEAPGLLSGADVPHAIHAEGAEILLVFLDPQSAAGAALSSTLKTPIRLLSDAEAAVVAAAEPASIMGKDGAVWADGVVAALGGAAVPRPAPTPARLRRVLAALHGAPPRADTSLAALAGIAGWSPGRLMHAFTASIGIPLRPYQSWLRLQRAAAAIVGGATLLDAAHAAGFADGAHMARTFRRMLGVPPSALRPAAAKMPPRQKDIM